ncbi:MAG: hypothetical protein INQ03_04870 [Candidatus Heimdallarchaeota archaeon]|nr:hypothetical protein [Candidatus Heimdallarchaeota archaeon]
MGITVFIIQRNGNANETRFTRSTISNERLVAVVDEVNQTLWVFNGKNIHSETKRLGAYTIDEINEKYKFEIKEISSSEWKEKSAYLYDLSKGKIDEEKIPQQDVIEEKTVVEEKIEVKEEENLAEKDLEESTPISDTEIDRITEQAKKQKEKYNLYGETEEEQAEAKSNLAKVGFAPLPTSRGIEQTKYQDPYMIKKQTPRTPESIPAPAVEEPTKPELDEQFVLAGDRATGEVMIDQFQISYYEQSGGSNFILIKELTNKINNSSEFKHVEDFVEAINNLCERNATQLTAKKVLEKQLDVLIKTLYRN